MRQSILYLAVSLITIGNGHVLGLWLPFLPKNIFPHQITLIDNLLSR